MWRALHKKDRTQVELTSENLGTESRRQVATPVTMLPEPGYDAALMRARVAALSQQCGGPALDIGTGACACLAVALARKGLRVTAVDHASSAVRIAQERAAGELSAYLDVRYAEATHLPFPNGAYRVVAAFDALCHAAEPAGVLAEMFRVCAHDGAVIITELNPAGRQATHHRDDGFEKKLPALLAPHCQDCQQVHDAFHITYVCRRETHVSIGEITSIPTAPAIINAIRATTGVRINELPATRERVRQALDERSNANV